MQQVYTDTAEPGPADGVAGVVAAMLQSPQFLYRPEPTTAATTANRWSRYALATRLSFLLTGAGPDDALLAAADGGGLDTEDGLLAETDRLLAGPRAGELFVHVATQWWELGGRPGARQGPQPLPDLDGRDAGRARGGDAPVPRRRLAGNAQPDDAAHRAGHVRRRGSGGVLRRAGAGRRRIPARHAGPDARGRAADAGVVPGRARQGRSDVARAARQVRPRQAVLPAAAAAAAGHRRDAADRRSAAVDAAAFRAAHRRRLAAPAVTSRWIRSGSRSSTTTPPDGGATSTATSPSTRPAC